MLAAYLVLPAFGLLYLWAAPRTRLTHLTLAAVVLAAVSLSWAVAVDVTPPAQRPWVGSTATNSELALIIGHNGQSILQPPLPHVAPYPVGFEVGPPGPLRLLDDDLAGQIGWLLPLALIGLLAASLQVRRAGGPQRRAVALWGLWLLTQAAFFSLVGFAHPYYLTLLAPALSALVSIGVVVLWGLACDAGRRSWLLPAGLLATAAVQDVILGRDPGWGRWLGPLEIGLCLLAVVLLVVCRPGTDRRHSRASRRVGMGIGMLALLIVPAVWGGMVAWSGRASEFPIAGPAALTDRGTAPPHVAPLLLRYLLVQRDGARFLVALPTAEAAAPFVLVTGQPVMAFNGTLGQDPILNPSQAAGLVAGNAVRFVLLPPGSSSPVARWVQDTCAPVDPALWQSGPADASPGPNSFQLYDCRPGPA